MMAFRIGLGVLLVVVLAGCGSSNNKHENYNDAECQPICWGDAPNLAGNEACNAKCNDLAKGDAGKD